ncbi:MAG: glutamate 5-kinase [Verrucomicrobiia bacterium]
MKLRQEILKDVKRVVVKLGTGLLTDEHSRLSRPKIELLVAQIVALHHQEKQVIVVSSGAIGAGMERMSLKQRPKRLDELQTAAAIGQIRLMAIYDQLFASRDTTVAQILLTHDDLKHRDRHLNARNTLEQLLKLGVVPIINENDTVAVEEIKFGDNDRLAALAATLIDADLLVVLSHVEGLYANPCGRGIPAPTGRDKNVAPTIIHTVAEINREIESLAGGTDRLTSVGGMKSKVEAAKIVTRAGIPMIIASGERPNVLADVLAGEEVGTVFLPRSVKLASRKRWIAFFQRPAGVLRVDDGAKQALCADGKSLLAKGIVAIEGKFERGDVVSIRDKNDVEFARGLVKVGGSGLEAATGVVVHRDDLVIL